MATEPVDADLKLWEQLSQEHPHYSEQKATWALHRDVAGDSEPKPETYLPKSKLEPYDQYQFRLKLSQWTPETSRAARRIVAALYKEKPKRSMRRDDLNRFLDDCDRKGTSWNAFMSRVMRHMLTYGTIRPLVNVKPGPREELSVAEAEELNVRPYVVLYSPLAVIDWDHDEDGKETMVRIRETRVGREEPGDPLSKHVTITRFIQYDRQKASWWEFAEKEGKQRKVDEGSRTHGLGVVPMVIRYWPEEQKPMVGASFIGMMAKHDLLKHQGESDRNYATWLHAHPFLKVWSEKRMTEIGIGAGTWLQLHPGTGGASREDASYVEAPVSAFGALDNFIEKQLAAVYRHAGTDPMAIEGSPTPTSGVARAWSFGTSEALLLSDLADVASDIEYNVLELVQRWLDGDQWVEGESELEADVQYPEEFELSTIDGLMYITGQAMQMINSPTFIRRLQMRIVDAKVGDLPAAELQKIHEEIEDNPLIGTLAGREDNAFGSPQPELSPELLAMMQGGGENGVAPEEGAPEVGSEGEPKGEEPEEEGGEAEEPPPPARGRRPRPPPVRA
jgi:hypothetical protein